MNIEFLYDIDTDGPHVHNHGVSEDEAIQVLENANLHLKGRRGATLAFGQTSAGRYLKVVYRKRSDGIFVITAYDLAGKALRAYRRRLRRKGK